MKHIALLLTIASILVSGCSSTRWVCGAGVATARPVVRLESVTPAADSPGRGSTFFPFPPAVYPYEMLRAGIAGEVVVRVEVGTDGRVYRSQIIASSQREFSIPAELAASQWRYFEFPAPGATKRLPMILDCRIVFEPSFEDEWPTFWGPMSESQKPNKAPEPTPRPVTIPAEPGIAPGRVVAHL